MSILIVLNLIAGVALVVALWYQRRESTTQVVTVLRTFRTRTGRKLHLIQGGGQVRPIHPAWEDENGTA